MSDDETRDKLRDPVGAVLTNAMNYPEKVAPRILGQNMGPLIDRVIDAILSEFVVVPKGPTKHDELIEKAREWVQEENWQSDYETDGFNAPGTDLISDLATALREESARADAAEAESDALQQRIDAALVLIDHPGMWSALDGRRAHLMSILKPAAPVEQAEGDN